MRRREFLGMVGGAAAVLLAPREAPAQEVGRTYRLGVFVQAPKNAAHWVAFLDELHKYGFVEGGNLSIVDAFNTPLDHAEAIAMSLVDARPDAITTAGVLTRYLQQLTQTIPIVTVSDDLVAEKAVASLAHPGGNTTGISIFATELDGKRQELLLEAIPLVGHLALLADPGVTRPRQLEELEKTARAHGIVASTHLAANPEGIIPAIDAASVAGAHALNVLASSLFNKYRAQIIERTATARLPAVYQWPEMAEEGGFMAYGPRFVTVYRQHALQVAKVLKGTKPGDIPVELPTRFELVLNLKAAKSLGLVVPPTLAERADEVIE
jgi:putative ABC transport system substrate-binding protein